MNSTLGAGLSCCSARNWGAGGIRNEPLTQRDRTIPESRYARLVELRTPGTPNCAEVFSPVSTRIRRVDLHRLSAVDESWSGEPCSSRIPWSERIPGSPECPRFSLTLEESGSSRRLRTPFCRSVEAQLGTGAAAARTIPGLLRLLRTLRLFRTEVRSAAQAHVSCARSCGMPPFLPLNQDPSPSSAACCRSTTIGSEPGHLNAQRPKGVGRFSTTVPLTVMPLL